RVKAAGGGACRRAPGAQAREPLGPRAVPARRRDWDTGSGLKHTVTSRYPGNSWLTAGGTPFARYQTLASGWAKNAQYVVPDQQEVRREHARGSDFRPRDRQYSQCPGPPPARDGHGAPWPPE